MVTVRQVRADGENRFQVEEEGKVLFRAQAPWEDIRLPFRMESLRQLHFTDREGRELFHTDCCMWDNAAESLFRYRYLFGESAKLAEYQIIDSGGVVRGSFYTRIDGAHTTQMVISCQDKMYDCYACARGKIYVVSIYDGERQIAQITKPLDTWDQLDLFYLHVTDDYREMLPLLSFFTIYVDTRKFSRPGRTEKHSVEKVWSYTYDTNDSRYDPGWIARTFGQSAEEQLSALLRERPERSLENPSVRRRIKKVLILCGASAAVLIAAAVLVVVILLRPKSPIQPSVFAQQMDANGYAVAEVSDQYGALEGESVYAAEKDGCTIHLIVFTSEEEAQRAFAAMEEELDRISAGSRVQSSASLPDSEKYTLTTGGTYYAVSRIGNTVVAGTAGESDKDEVKKVLRELGY